ncbi:MAG: hypothetical protein OQK12_09910 [Motiliproteus sp.]|nr:hypothetical protein [Motiliproteus sp.]MCW9051274.1 hypothetical protein [Motiliproteus sp.]
MFAKIFESKEYGQLCAISSSENDENKPEIRVFAEPDGLGVCSSAIMFEESDSGWSRRDTGFSKLDLTAAEAIAKPLFDFAAGMNKGEG